MATVLIVDDEMSVRKSLRLLLEVNGYQVLEAEDANKAYDLLFLKLRTIDELPEVMLLDVMMPGMSSAELLKKMKEDEFMKEVKVIFLTAVKDAKDILEGQEGVFDTFEKPYDNKELLAAIKKASEKELT